MTVNLIHHDPDPCQSLKYYNFRVLNSNQTNQSIPPTVQCSFNCQSKTSHSFLSTVPASQSATASLSESLSLSSSESASDSPGVSSQSDNGSMSVLHTQTPTSSLTTTTSSATVQVVSESDFFSPTQNLTPSLTTSSASAQVVSENSPSPTGSSSSVSQSVSASMSEFSIFFSSVSAMDSLFTRQPESEQGSVVACSYNFSYVTYNPNVQK